MLLKSGKAPDFLRKLAWLLLPVFLQGCFHHARISLEPEPDRCSQSVCRGVASWYGKEFHGRKTASGETYDMYGMTAAHRTLPLGTLLKVTLPGNIDAGGEEKSRSVIVKVNDRGPFVPGRVLDLSFGAARELGIDLKGTAEIIYRVVQVPRDLPPGVFTVQAGAFSVKENAVLFLEKVSRITRQEGRIVPHDSPSGLLYRVRVGRFGTEQEAQKAAGLLLRENGIIPFIIKDDFPLQ